MPRERNWQRIEMTPEIEWGLKDWRELHPDAKDLNPLPHPAHVAEESPAPSPT
jgi:hypothetical protein